MFEQINKLSFKDWGIIFLDIMFHIFRKWHLCLLAIVLSAAIGFWLKPADKTTYTATISFVLSTETKSSGLSGIASQFGLEVGTGGSENIFSGDNIIELFKSRKMVSNALMHEIDGSDTNLLTYITNRLYPAESKSLLPFPGSIEKFSFKQKAIFIKISKLVAASFSVFKKDKKLIFYLISATSTDSGIAYHIAKNMLDQTSQYFIETKTRVATSGLELLSKEADSLSTLLGFTFRASASLADRSFNINPSISTQRSGAQLNQAKAAALGAAYTEVMRNLEIAKINVQKETPLFQVIDEPALPLLPQVSSGKGTIYWAAILGLIIMIGLLSLEQLFSIGFLKL